jgi:hypothetical protein
MNSKLILLLFLIFAVVSIQAQHASQVVLKDIPFEPKIPIKKDLVEKLEQNSLYGALSKEAQSFIYWTNYSRIYPKEFKELALLTFLEVQPKLKGKYANSLMEDLSQTQSLPFLEPESKLIRAAQLHTEDIAKNNGRVSHQSSDGASFGERIKRIGYKACSAENIAVGNDPNGLSSLLLLYLDINLPDLGHRKNLLNPNYTKIGVSVKELSNNQYLIVQELACPELTKN